MTLVLSVATPDYALHVSDRLVSANGKRVDALANKTVVFRATDGLVAIGYTGIAFIDGLPTDSWIADVLSHQTAASVTASAVHGRVPVRDLGSSLEELLQKLRATAFHRYGGAIVAVGWQWKRNRHRSIARHVLWVLRSSSTRSLHWAQLLPRSWEVRRKVAHTFFIGRWPLGDSRWWDLNDAITQAGADWALVESLLINAIREASAVRPGSIGADCTSVLLRPGEDPEALIRFHPNAPHIDSEIGDQEDVEVSYSPWVISPDGIRVPSISVGRWTIEGGILSILMDFPHAPPGQRLLGALTSQKRPRR